MLVASSFGASCQQQYAYPNMSEDCLFLNVWTPAGKSGPPLPVMFFIHGGSYVMGSGSFDGSKFVSKSGGEVREQHEGGVCRF